MFEKVKELAFENKVTAGMILVGLVLGLFFLVHGRANQPQEGMSLAQEVAQVETESSKMSTVNQKSSHKDEDSKKESADDESQWISVDVKGAVKHPGVYQVASQSRVQDVIKKAGGLTEEADSQSINLAQKLQDEGVVYVAREEEHLPSVATTSPSRTENSTTSDEKGNLVNLNTATEADLQTISGIGEKRAQDIIAYRESNGKFSTVDDLQNVSGIGAKTLEKLKAYVTVD